MQANANALLKQAITMVEKLGIETGEIVPNVKLVNVTSYWGKCTRKGDSHYITLNKKLIQANVEGALETLIHEVLHTVKGCMNHGETWKSLAKKVNTTYGTNISRATSATENGTQEFILATSKYVMECDRCGHGLGRDRMSNFVKHPEDYIHPNCGGKFKRVK